MKKVRKIEYEGPVEVKPGVWATDTGDPWHAEMPRIFWTPEARRLFSAATAAGILKYEFVTGKFRPGNGITKAQLAYWCKRASTFLGLDRGGTTSWKPFEDYFNYPEFCWKNRAGQPIETIAPTPLKASLWCLKDQPAYSVKRETNSEGYRLDQVAQIDDFFSELDKDEPQ